MEFSVGTAERLPVLMNEVNRQTNVPLLEMRGIDKSFSGVQALKDVSLELNRGEVLALIGENGAGKSTLVKVLGGAHTPEHGAVHIDGRAVSIHSPSRSQRLGISLIYQEFSLIPDLTVRENVFLGREKTWAGFVRTTEEHRHALELFKRIGIVIDPNARCAELTLGQQQTVEIAKALSVDAKIIVMDEPTAALDAQEVERLFAIIRELKAQGMGVIYISHRLDEIFDIADRVMVLRDGECVGVEAVYTMSRDKIIEMMVGRSLKEEFPERSACSGSERMRVEKLCRAGSVYDISFALHAGEILGFAGLAGAGRTETARLIFGADRADSGRIFIDGKEVFIRSPRDAIANRICLLTEDRKGQGLILIHSVRENFGLPNLDKFQKGPFVNRKRERSELARYVENLKIKLADNEQAVMNLSGGNQQKVVLAKWLAQDADIVIFDEPTRGIDVGAKYEIYLLMNKLVADGRAVIMISSELPEILGMSDRIIVMHEGRLKGEITDVEGATQADILSMALS